MATKKALVPLAVETGDVLCIKMGKNSTEPEKSLLYVIEKMLQAI